MRVESDRDLFEIASAQHRVHRFDIDAAYDRHIKGIYSAIIAFISGMKFSRQDETSSRLYWLREACKDIVEAVKDAKHLQKNLLEYVGSENDSLNMAYNQLRSLIASVIRDIQDMRAEEQMHVSSLEALKLLVKEDEVEMNRMLSKLIGKNVVTPEQGTSLMNDSGYAFAIVSNLIKATDTLFVTRDRDLTQTIHNMLKDHHELDNISTEKNEPEESLQQEEGDGPRQTA